MSLISGTAAAYLAFCNTTRCGVADCGAAVKMRDERLEAPCPRDNLRMKSTSPDSIQHSRTSGARLKILERAQVA